MSAVATMEEKDMRVHQRTRLWTEVEINDGTPYRGGMLHDFSRGGAAVMYPEGTSPEGDPLEVGQPMVLKFDGKASYPGKIARIFDGGFATQFEFSIDPAAA